MARAPVFSHNKGNHVGFTKLLFRRKFIHCAMMHFSFHLHIAYRKVRNLRIGVNKLVGKVSINLLCHTTKSAVCVISIIRLACYSSAGKVVHLNKLIYVTRKQIKTVAKVGMAHA